jgi:hypothetical protein
MQEWPASQIMPAAQSALELQPQAPSTQALPSGRTAQSRHSGPQWLSRLHARQDVPSHQVPIWQPATHASPHPSGPPHLPWQAGEQHCPWSSHTSPAPQVPHFSPQPLGTEPQTREPQSGVQLWHSVNPGAAQTCSAGQFSGHWPSQSSGPPHLPPQFGRHSHWWVVMLQAMGGEQSPSFVHPQDPDRQAIPAAEPLQSPHIPQPLGSGPHSMSPHSGVQPWHEV